jgi:SAM-dependent methyltransferase
VSAGGDARPECRGAELAQALVLSQAPSACLRLTASVLEDFDPFDSSGAVARASQQAIVVPEGLTTLPENMWAGLLASCREALRPDGVLVLRLARDETGEPRAVKAVLASYFSAVDLFAWDGLWRMAPAAGCADLFAICRPFLPYATRSLELLRPRVVAGGEGWQSSWLCERPALPGCFLLRATVDMIGDNPDVELRLRFLAPERARFKMQGWLNRLESGCAELFISSRQAEARGEPRWGEVERIAIDVRTSSEEPLDIRISDVRILAEGNSHEPVVGRASVRLRDRYSADYYKGMTGYTQYRDRRELCERVNVHRAYALLLSPAPARVLDIGSGRGELAMHLIEGGTDVTLLDYSPAAMEFARGLIGERSEARFVVDDAVNLGAHVAPGSQDAIFMTDFVEHMDVEELGAVLGECRRALASDGALIIHTPERYSGSIATASAIHGLHVNLFEIATLGASLREIFGAVETFTWDGFERFSQRGHCIELFALAWPQEPYLSRSLPVTVADLGDSAGETLGAACGVDCPQLPPRFILDVTVQVPPDAEGLLEVAFQTATGEHVARAARELSQLKTLPARLRLASELLMPGTPSGWEAVERIVVSVRSGRGSHRELVVSDVRLSAAQASSADTRGWEDIDR